MHNCPQCLKASRCDIEDGRSVCWCFAETVLSADASTQANNASENTSCLCKTCLRKAIAAAQALDEPTVAVAEERSY